MKVTAIILAAGKGKRVGGDIPKQYIEVGGKPVIYYALNSFEQSCVDEIVIVADPEELGRTFGGENTDAARTLRDCGFSKVSMVVSGGAERYFSVLNALRMAGSRCGDGRTPDYVLIHDGARPYITSEGINKLVNAVCEYSAVVAASPSKDTIKITDKDGFVVSTTDRSVTWQAQTPQCFQFADILEAYEKVVAPLEGLVPVSSGCGNAPADIAPSKIAITDDAMVYEQAYPDRRIKLIDTGSENGKITTAADIEYMRYKMSL